MTDLFWLTDVQIERLRLCFPKSHGKPQVDDKRMLGGIICINRNGLRWRDTLREYGPYKALHDRWIRWSRMGVFARIMAGLAAGRADCRTIMNGGMNTRLHAVTDREGRPVRLFVTAGQVSDDRGALQSDFPEADWLIADRGYDADWFREALSDSKIRACIPPRKSRTVPINYDKRRYRRRHRIEIVFARIKDWRRVATRYDRCPKVFLSAIALAATVIYWL